jgi:hypothetical protein
MNASEPGRDVESSQAMQTEPSTLAQLEAIIEGGLPHYEEVALAMLEIHDRKLFKPLAFKNYLKVRWTMSRSRGYQLLHFARLKKMSTRVDITGVANERTAQALARDGTVRRQCDRDPVEEAMRYLGMKFKKLTLVEKRDLIQYVRKLMDELEALLA